MIKKDNSRLKSSVIVFKNRVTASSIGTFFGHVNFFSLRGNSLGLFYSYTFCFFLANSEKHFYQMRFMPIKNIYMPAQ